MNKPVLACHDLSKTFLDEAESLNVLKDINFSVERAETIAITGSSGCGKTTFLQLLGGLDQPTSGYVEVNGQNLEKLTEKTITHLRNQVLGFVYQMHHLMPEFNALENVAMPLLIRGESKKVAFEAAHSILENVELAHRSSHRPAELSGGERQRVAIARALVTHPLCVLADEPTGNLDEKTAEKMYELMLSLNETLKTSFVIVTHDLALADKLSAQYAIEDAKIQKIR